MYLQDSGLDSFELTDRDRAAALLEQLDYEQQLLAIHGLLRRNKAADDQLASERIKIETYIQNSEGEEQDHAVDLSGEHFYATVYQDAAHSMAALGMIAPMYEALLFQGFHGIRNLHFGAIIPPGHNRSGMAKADEFWDCHLLFNTSTNKTERKLVLGIQQLSEAIGLTPYLPSDLHRTLEALFSYRNKMLHWGFEWPKNQSENFAYRVKTDGWGSWFDWSERSNNPWIVYMTDCFINHCLDTIDQLLEAFGKYSKDRGPLQLIPVEVK